MSLSEICISDKVLAEFCIAGGWPLAATLDILKFEAHEDRVKVFFSFIESQSACCSCISSDAEWLRYGECDFSGFSLKEIKDELLKNHSKGIDEK